MSRASELKNRLHSRANLSASVVTCYCTAGREARCPWREEVWWVRPISMKEPFGTTRCHRETPAWLWQHNLHLQQ